MLKNLLFVFIFLCFSYSSHAQSWSILGTGTHALNANTVINSICTDGANIYAAGDFTNGISFNSGYQYVAKWDGTNWSELGTGANALNANDIISDICLDNSGNIYAVGDFTNATGYYYVAKWNGSSWSELGTGANALNATEGISAVCTDKFGAVYATNNYSEDVVKWNGSSWTTVGILPSSNDGSIYSLCSDLNGNIYAAGGFKNSIGNYYVAKWDGSAWSELGSWDTHSLKANSFIDAICVDEQANVYAAGNFTNTNGYHYVAKWDGSDWNEMGTGTNALKPNNTIFSVICDHNGTVYAGGDFTDSNGNVYVAYWNGTNWNRLGNTYSENYGIATMCAGSFNEIYIAGYLNDVSGKYYVATIAGVTTGVTDAALTANLSFYPNPTSGNITLNSPEAGQVKVYNSLGESIMVENVTADQASFTVEKLQNGIYSIQLVTATTTYAPLKIIKQ